MLSFASFSLILVALDGKPAGARLVEADFFHDRLAFYDFVVNLAIHLLALVAALGLVIDGYVFYVEGG